MTGASSGMGRETVIQLADRFACLDEIWVLARRKDRLFLLERQVPVKLRIFGADIADKKELADFERTLKEVSPDTVSYTHLHTAPSLICTVSQGRPIIRLV